MKPIKLDVEEIERLCKEKVDENYRFRGFLKCQNSERVDRIVSRLYKDIAAQINCIECANCCKKLKTAVSLTEIEHLASLENISPEEFTARFTEKDDFDGKRSLKDLPCKYLINNKCTIYANRPNICKSYPHIHQPGFTSRTFDIIEYAEICPIVYNVFENLKAELGFQCKR